MLVAEIAEKHGDFTAAGISLAFVGHGSLKKANEYAKGAHLQDKPVPLYVDEDKATHQVLKLKSLGTLKLLADSKGISLSRAASAKGYSVGLVGTGDHNQQGGIGIFARDAESDDQRLLYLKQAQKPYDYPSPEDLLAKCKKVAGKNASSAAAQTAADAASS